jgi:lipopolysaccharide transport system ATP-binding protein
MNSDIAIKAENLTKIYKLYNSHQDRLKESLHPLRKKYHHDFHALRDVCFEIYKGETVGIIGRNGSGKSTLLKVITGVLTPNSGTVTVNGRISALLELGAGFNPELTGLENIYFNGTLMGFTREEMDRKLDDILSFADIGEFVHQPVKTYSSGMFVRLAFAINISVDPEIMIVDEALAVGDMNFQAKCMTALTRVQEGGATVLFVSHDIGALKSLCSRGIYLEHGAVRSMGKAPDVAEEYIRVMREEMNQELRRFVRVSPGFVPKPEALDTTVKPRDNGSTELKRSAEFDKRVAKFRYGAGGARITYVELLNMDGEPLQSVNFNQEVKICIHVEASSVQDISVNFNILDDKKVNLAGCGFLQAGQELLHTEIGGLYLVEYALRLPFQDGSYSMRALISSPVVSGETAEFLDVVEDAVVFRIDRWAEAKVWSKIHLFPSVRLEKIQRRTGFIIGTGRCGTSMLAQMLDAHSRICVPHELQILFEYSSNGPRLYEIFQNRTNEHYGPADFVALIEARCPHKFQEYFDYKSFFERQHYPILDLKELVSTLYSEIAASRSKDILIEQTPWYGQRIDILHELFPDAKYIHIIRDGRDVAISFARTPWWHDDIGQNLEMWHTEIRHITDLAQTLLKPDQIMQVRYEDFVEQPEAGLREICDFLGVGYEDSMLEPARYIDYGLYKKSDTTKISSAALNEWSKRKDIPTFKGSRYAWKNCTDFDFSTMPEHIRRSLRTFGYEA